MATLRVSEKEAIERGWIPASEAKETPVRYIRVPVVEVQKVYRKGFTIWHFIAAMVGWFLGFGYSMLFK